MKYNKLEPYTSMDNQRMLVVKLRSLIWPVWGNSTLHESICLTLGIQEAPHASQQKLSSEKTPTLCDPGNFGNSTCLVSSMYSFKMQPCHLCLGIEHYLWPYYVQDCIQDWSIGRDSSARSTREKILETEAEGASEGSLGQGHRTVGKGRGEDRKGIVGRGRMWNETKKRWNEPMHESAESDKKDKESHIGGMSQDKS
ncbi:hypothetical protein BDR06DRAFT_974250 [Suillus hirtellus]|nr:hypothetical protein BDR06DRAFT_974250 [Suillus hirtellus]